MLFTNEAFSRVKIDSQLRSQGWEIENPNAVRFEYVLGDSTRADYVLLFSTAAHGTKKLDTSVLVSLPIQIPPLDRQREFTCRAIALDSIRDQQEDALLKASATFDSLLARAFSREIDSRLPLSVSAAT